jgi:precorrin-8X/cobalt-precorrin-8 methylmutase
MITEPALIEQKSFEIIESELGADIPGIHKPVIYRIIHTTADFEYASITEVHPDAVSRGVEAVKNGCSIYADTNMICSGVNKNILGRHNCRLYTLVSDKETVEQAKARGVTRSIVGMEKACRDRSTKIFIIGNAPTALFTLKKEIDAGRTSPDLVIAVPVGFVGAAESKHEFRESGVPYIITRGRKGGSTVAVSIMNAILLMTGK